MTGDRERTWRADEPIEPDSEFARRLEDRLVAAARGEPYPRQATQLVLPWVAALVAVATLASVTLVTSPPTHAPSPSDTTSDPAPDRSVTSAGGALSVGEGLQILDIASTPERTHVLAGLVGTAVADRGPRQAVVVSLDHNGSELWRAILDDTPLHLAANLESVWVAQFDTGAVVRLDAADGSVIGSARVELPQSVGGPDGRLFVPGDLVSDTDGAWLSTYRGAIAWISNDFVTEVWQFEGGGADLAIDGDSAWLALGDGGVARVTPGREAEVVPAAELGRAASLVAVSDGRLFVASSARPESGVVSLGGGGVHAHHRFSQPVMALGRVNGFFGAVTQDRIFHHLTADEPMVRAVSRLDQLGGGSTAVLGHRWLIEDFSDTWLVDGRTATVLIPAGTRELAIDLRIDDSTPERRPVLVGTDTSPDWERVADPPLDPRWPEVFAWDDAELSIWGGTHIGSGAGSFGDGAAYDPASESWRVIDGRPETPVAPEVDLTESGLSPNSRAGVRLDRTVLAVDYELETARLEDGRWSGGRAVPLRFFECYIAVHRLGDLAVVDYCGALAVGDGEEPWMVLAGPHLVLEHAPAVTTGGGTIWWYDATGVYRFVADPTDPSTLSRVRVGVVTAVRPQGWTFEKAEGDASTIVVPVSAPGGKCRIRAIHGEAGAMAASMVTGESVEEEVVPDVGGEPYFTVRFTDDAGMTRYLFAPGGTDLIDVGCPDRVDALRLMRAIVWPYQ